MSAPFHRRQVVWGLAGALGVGCVRPQRLAPVRPSGPMLPPLKAEEALARLRAREPESFKMVHQVVARYGKQQHVMTGYLLGRKDGSFRVSAAAALGPGLFDVAKVRGRWEAQVHLAQLSEKLDPRHIGRAVERIYFIDAQGPLAAERGRWVQRADVSAEEDFGRVEVWREAATLAMVRKRFFRGRERVLEVSYESQERVQEHWLARRVQLEDARGFQIALSVIDYVPGFPAPDERLRLGDRT